MKARDSFHASGVGTVHAGKEFEVHDALGKDLQDRGLADVVGGAKAEPTPQNKVAPAPANKAETLTKIDPKPIKPKVDKPLEDDDGA